MKLEKNAPTSFKEIYIKNWVSGVKGGGSGINIFIEIDSKELVLDSVFFRKKSVKLETKPSDPQLFIGRFMSEVNSEETSLSITNSKDDKNLSFPFNLKDDECVVSYTQNGQIKYYKLTNIVEKPIDALPMSAPPNKNKGKI
ncbi:MAG: hypothetical protein ED556_03230 [Winogradskyella sp.]|uniref:hypothetical protein n=1 Tax=Winogradskyella sp. TaxID=1883156 RepID=UPI000F3E1213|nr:hypothetical protein [Winogradskyella sp.]RNC88210.1 MAG: hypothetical protein ED556_03230 [Winogradskyella sp.]